MNCSGYTKSVIEYMEYIKAFPEYKGHELLNPFHIFVLNVCLSYFNEINLRAVDTQKRRLPRLKQITSENPCSTTVDLKTNFLKNGIPHSFELLQNKITENSYDAPTPEIQQDVQTPEIDQHIQTPEVQQDVETPKIQVDTALIKKQQALPELDKTHPSCTTYCNVNTINSIFNLSRYFETHKPCPEYFNWPLLFKKLNELVAKDAEFKHWNAKITLQSIVEIFKTLYHNKHIKINAKAVDLMFSVHDSLSKRKYVGFKFKDLFPNCIYDYMFEISEKVSTQERKAVSNVSHLQWRPVKQSELI